MKKNILVISLLSSFFLVGCANANMSNPKPVMIDSNNTVNVNSSCSVKEEKPEVIYKDQITNVSVKENTKPVMIVNYHNGNSCIFPVTVRK